MRHVASKWLKSEVLKKHEGLARHMPAMCRYNRRNLKSWLNRYAFVVAKPIVGARGVGVVKVQKVGQARYELHQATHKKVYTSWEAVWCAMERVRKGRRYLLQQGIDLATVNGRKADYRVKLVKEGGRWKVTAVVARLAARGRFVTNLARGGQLMKGREALRHSFPAQMKPKKDTMVGVARTCTFLLEKRYSGLSALGYDFGIDRRGDIWLFEVNTRPG